MQIAQQFAGVEAVGEAGPIHSQQRGDEEEKDGDEGGLVVFKAAAGPDWKHLEGERLPVSRSCSLVCKL